MINSSAVILTDIYRCHSAMWILAAGGGAQREHAGLFTLFARFAEPVVGQLATSAVICAAKIGLNNSTGFQLAWTAGASCRYRPRFRAQARQALRASCCYHPHLPSAVSFAAFFGQNNSAGIREARRLRASCCYLERSRWS